MSNIEPTEEQMQKGEQMYASSDYMTSRDFAEILAEREAKLREEMERIIEAVHVQMAATALPQPLIDVVRGVYAEHPYALHRIEDLEKVCHALQDERDTLRARVAELEAIAGEVSDMRAQLDIADTREAQHLADIKALRGFARRVEQGYDHDLDAHKYGTGCRCCLAEEALAATAHYDDAKADAPRECGHPCCGQTCGPREERKTDAPAVCRPDDNACGYCSFCKAGAR